MEPSFANAYIHTPVLAVFGSVTLGANILHLMSLKANKKIMNNNDRVQCLKSMFVILAVVSYIPVEIWLIQSFTGTPDTCLIRDVFQSLFLDSYPVGMLTVAVIRLRIATCQVNCDVTVRWSFYCLASVAFVAVQVLSASSKLIFNILVKLPAQQGHTNETQNIPCNDYHGANYVGGVSTVLLYWIPAIFVTLIYAKIIKLSSVSIRRVLQYRTNGGSQSIGGSSFLVNYRSSSSVSPQSWRHVSISGTPTTPQLNGNMNFQRGLTIQKSIFTMVACFIVSTIPVSAMEIYRSMMETDTAFYIALVYLKVLMCLSHAVGEGIFHREKRDRIRLFVKSLSKEPSRGSNCIETGRLAVDRANPNPMYPRLEYLSTLNEESGQISGNTCIDDVFVDEIPADRDKISLISSTSEQASRFDLVRRKLSRSKSVSAKPQGDIGTIFELKERIEAEDKSECSVVTEHLSDIENKNMFEKDGKVVNSCVSPKVHQARNTEIFVSTPDNTSNEMSLSVPHFLPEVTPNDTQHSKVSPRSLNSPTDETYFDFHLKPSSRLSVRSFRSPSWSDYGQNEAAQTPRSRSNSARFFFFKSRSQPATPNKGSPQNFERCRKSSFSINYIPDLQRRRRTTAGKNLLNENILSIENLQSNTPSLSDVTVCSRRTSFDRLGGISSVSDILDCDTSSIPLHNGQKTPALHKDSLPGEVVGSLRRISNIYETM